MDDLPKTSFELDQKENKTYLFSSAYRCRSPTKTDIGSPVSASNVSSKNEKFEDSARERLQLAGGDLGMLNVPTAKQLITEEEEQEEDEQLLGDVAEAMDQEPTDTEQCHDDESEDEVPLEQVGIYTEEELLELFLKTMNEQLAKNPN